jgi:hypothetical protein
VLQARGRFAVVFLAFGFLLFFGNVGHSQAQSTTFPTSLGSPSVISRPCGEHRTVPDTRRESISRRDSDHSDKLCAELPFDRNRNGTPPRWPSDTREGEDRDSVAEELKAMGEQGLMIVQAREEVLEILEGQNRCSAWFEQAEPDAIKKFRSLRYRIAESGPGYTLKIQGADGNWRYQQPYVASSIEGAGAGSTITINASGAFFQLRSGLRIVPADGGPGGLGTSQLQHIDLYVGGTLRAQVITLLHEFSHVAGLLPADGGSLAGGELSTQNTQTVLRHCRAQVEAAGKDHRPFLNTGTPVFSSGKP